MEYRHAGRSGLRVSRLGLSTRTWGPHPGADTGGEAAAEQLHAFLDAGGDLVDVGGISADARAGTGADVGAGLAEELLGKLIGPLAHRDELVISATAPVPVLPTGPDLSRRALITALDATLTRLGVDHVDVWTAPGWSPRVPLAETLSALETAVRSGRARYAGLADVAGWQAALAACAAERNGPGTPVAVRAEYCLLRREPERELLPAVDHLGLGFLASARLGHGRGRVLDAVATAAEGLGHTPLDVALAWVRDRPGVTSVLVHAGSVDHLRAILATEDVALPAEIVAALDEVSA